MEIYADSANIELLKKVSEMGILSGITTNPEILSRESKKKEAVIEKLCHTFPEYKIFVQVTGSTKAAMIAQAKGYAEISPRIVIKVPASYCGIQAIHELKKGGVKNEVCATTILTSAQALFCAASGADYVAPYVEDISNVGYLGMETLKEIVEAIKGFDTKVLAAAVNRAQDMVKAVCLGADIITVTPEAILSVFEKPFPITKWYLDMFADAENKKS